MGKIKEIIDQAIRCVLAVAIVFVLAYASVCTLQARGYTPSHVPTFHEDKGVMEYKGVIYNPVDFGESVMPREDGETVWVYMVIYESKTRPDNRLVALFDAQRGEIVIYGVKEGEDMTLMMDTDCDGVFDKDITEPQPIIIPNCFGPQE